MFRPITHLWCNQIYWPKTNAFEIFSSFHGQYLQKYRYKKYLRNQHKILRYKKLKKIKNSCHQRLKSTSLVYIIHFIKRACKNLLFFHLSILIFINFQYKTWNLNCWTWKPINIAIIRVMLTRSKWNLEAIGASVDIDSFSSLVVALWLQLSVWQQCEVNSAPCEAFTVPFVHICAHAYFSAVASRFLYTSFF